AHPVCGDFAGSNRRTSRRDTATRAQNHWVAIIPHVLSPPSSRPLHIRNCSVAGSCGTAHCFATLTPQRSPLDSIRQYSVIFAYHERGALPMPITARQKRVLDYIRHYFDLHQEAPTIAQIGKQFGMTSSASAHNVVAILEREGFIRRIPNVSRGIELVDDGQPEAKYEIPLLGIVAAGNPIEAILNYETVCVPRDMMREGRMFALRVRGDSMIDEQIREHDIIVLQSKQTAENGQTVVALIDGS